VIAICEFALKDLSYLPDSRGRVTDKGKPVARLGRKAEGLVRSHEMAKVTEVVQSPNQELTNEAR